jgi:pimeloyl-ACP methyl ester carboxylesterase
MRTLHERAHADRQTATLVILLPGALQQPEELIRAGFVEAVRQRGLSIDLLLADLGIEQIGDATNGSAHQRIDALVQTARGQGYATIWLGGISIGGLMALAYADRYRHQVDGLCLGLCLLSPYPGNRILLREIAAAGALAHWPADAVPNHDAEHRMWRWLQTRSTQPRIHMGYGLEDRFASGLQQMAQALDLHHVDTISGGHDWPTWMTLWERFLDQTWDVGCSAVPADTRTKNR